MCEGIPIFRFSLKNVQASGLSLPAQIPGELVFVLCSKPAPDVPFLFVELQELPHLLRQGGGCLGKTLCQFLVYGPKCFAAARTVVLCRTVYSPSSMARCFSSSVIGLNSNTISRTAAQLRRSSAASPCIRVYSPRFGYMTKI